MGVDSERRVVGAGVGGGASGFGSFLGGSGAALLVVREAGGVSSILGGVYLRVVLGVLLCGAGTGVALLLRLVFDCAGAGAAGCCCGG